MGLWQFLRRLPFILKGPRTSRKVREKRWTDKQVARFRNLEEGYDRPDVEYFAWLSEQGIPPLEVRALLGYLRPRTHLHLDKPQ